MIIPLFYIFILKCTILFLLLLTSPQSLFLEHFHNDLLDTLQQILKQDSVALFIAPRRGTSMSTFADKAKLQGYDVAIEGDYDAQVSHEHQRFQSEPESGYNPDIHFPVLMKLCKPKNL